MESNKKRILGIVEMTLLILSLVLVYGGINKIKNTIISNEVLFRQNVASIVGDKLIKNTEGDSLLSIFTSEGMTKMLTGELPMLENVTELPPAAAPEMKVDLEDEAEAVPETEALTEGEALTATITEEIKKMGIDLDVLGMSAEDISKLQETVANETGQMVDAKAPIQVHELQNIFSMEGFSMIENQVLGNMGKLGGVIDIKNLIGNWKDESGSIEPGVNRICKGIMIGYTVAVFGCIFFYLLRKKGVSFVALLYCFFILGVMLLAEYVLSGGVLFSEFAISKVFLIHNSLVYIGVAILSLIGSSVVGTVARYVE